MANGNNSNTNKRVIGGGGNQGNKGNIKQQQPQQATTPTAGDLKAAEIAAQQEQQTVKTPENLKEGESLQVGETLYVQGNIIEVGQDELDAAAHPVVNTPPADPETPKLANPADTLAGTGPTLNISVPETVSVKPPESAPEVETQTAVAAAIAPVVPAVAKSAIDLTDVSALEGAADMAVKAKAEEERVNSPLATPAEIAARKELLKSFEHPFVGADRKIMAKNAKYEDGTPKYQIEFDDVDSPLATPTELRARKELAARAANPFFGYLYRTAA